MFANLMGIMCSEANKSVISFPNWYTCVTLERKLHFLSSVFSFVGVFFLCWFFSTCRCASISSFSHVLCVNSKLHRTANTVQSHMFGDNLSDCSVMHVWPNWNIRCRTTAFATSEAKNRNKYAKHTEHTEHKKQKRIIQLKSESQKKKNWWTNKYIAHVINDGITLILSAHRYQADWVVSHASIRHDNRRSNQWFFFSVCAEKLVVLRGGSIAEFNIRWCAVRNHSTRRRCL